jgi:hypothetical protein
MVGFVRSFHKQLMCHYKQSGELQHQQLFGEEGCGAPHLADVQGVISGSMVHSSLKIK